MRRIERGARAASRAPCLELQRGHLACIFGYDQILDQEHRREDGMAMRRIDDIRMRGPEHEARELAAPLRLWRERNIAAAIDPIARSLIGDPQLLTRSGEGDPAKLALDVALVEAADEVMLIAKALRPGVVAGEQQPGGFDPA